jgi:hypothetical protein
MANSETFGKAVALKAGMAQSHEQTSRWPGIEPSAKNMPHANAPFPLTPTLSLGAYDYPHFLLCFLS